MVELGRGWVPPMKGKKIPERTFLLTFELPWTDTKFPDLEKTHLAPLSTLQDDENPDKISKLFASNCSVSVSYEQAPAPNCFFDPKHAILLRRQHFVWWGKHFLYIVESKRFIIFSAEYLFSLWLSRFHDCPYYTILSHFHFHTSLPSFEA